MDAQTFLSGEAWINPDGEVFSAWCYNEHAAGIVSTDARELRTADAWAKRIDRDKLAGVIQSVLDRWFDGYSGGHGEIADAVLAALPKLMAGEQA